MEKIPLIPRLETIDLYIQKFSQLLTDRGWIVSGDNDNLAVFSKFKNGKVRKGPAVSLVFYDRSTEERLNYDTLEFEVVERQLTGRERPWRVDSWRFGEGQTYSTLKGAMTCFITEALNIDPIYGTPKNPTGKENILTEPNEKIDNLDDDDLVAKTSDTTALDEDAQPIHSRFNHKRVTDRSIDELLGLCRGVIADNHVSENEAIFILNWLNNNKLAADIWPGKIIAERIARHLEDGVIDSEESADLLQLLQDVTGEHYQALTADNMSTACFDNPQPEVLFKGCRFCLTGKFAMGPRKACELEIIDLGGEVGTLTKETNFLVVGSIGSRDWIHTSYGRKIEKVKQWQQEGRPIAIISEDHWATHL